ncbi:MAG: hypothetical protein V1848_00230 [Candidatus Magasanikbacteria bacterium]
MISMSVAIPMGNVTLKMPLSVRTAVEDLAPEDRRARYTRFVTKISGPTNQKPTE